MKRNITARAVAGALIFTLTYTPIFGAMTSTVATAQTVQNTIYTYKYDANGNLTKVTDPLGRVTDLSYDSLGRPTQQTFPAPQASATRPVVQYNYDGRDQLSTVTDPRKLVTAYTTDGLGNQSGLDSPDTGRNASTYDMAGNLLASTDARGKASTYSYDAINRITRIDYASGLASVFEYDGGKASVPNAIGKLTGMTDESGNTRYAYDGFGRIASKTQTVVLGKVLKTFSVGYSYGNTGPGTGKLAGLTYPSGKRVNYIYDKAGQLSRLTVDSASPGDGGVPAEASVDLLTGIFYAPFGDVQSWYWGNSTEAAVNGYARTFDLDGRITSYTLGNVQTSGVLRRVSYDAAGRILSYTHEGSSFPVAPVVLDQTFAFDDLDRLIGTQSATTNCGFVYDANGNRTQSSIGSNSYINTIDGSSNRLMSTTGPAPAKTNVYDAIGNLSSDGETSYIYSDRGRLARTNKIGLTTSYLYNAIGQRVSKTSNPSSIGAGTTYFVYDEQGHLLGEYGIGGVVLQETVYLGNSPVAVLANGISYVYVDHLNTPRLITRSSDNAIVWRWDQADPFGVQQPDENPSDAGVFTYNLRFPGQLFDKETNNHYNYFRDYDPQTGRYIQSDPIGLQGGINTYVYVSANPLFRVDPLGLEGPNSGWSKGVTDFRVSPLPILSYYSNEMSRLAIAQGNGSGPDNVFHCVAACKAKKAGNDVDYIRFLMNQKENSDYLRGRLGLYGDGRSRGDAEMTADNDHDKAVNEVGLSCPENNTYEAQCDRFVVTLARKSQKRMRDYLASPKYRKY